jgi:hypothetical protein
MVSREQKIAIMVGAQKRHRERMAAWLADPVIRAMLCTPLAIPYQVTLL